MLVNRHFLLPEAEVTVVTGMNELTAWVLYDTHAMFTQNSLVCHQLPSNQSCKYQVNKMLPPTIYDFTYHISAVFETATKCVYIGNF